VSSIPILPSLDPLKNGYFSIRIDIVIIFVYPFYLYGFKEAFSYCIVPEISLS
jgi:hypothetical protein